MFYILSFAELERYFDFTNNQTGEHNPTMKVSADLSRGDHNSFGIEVNYALP